MKINKIIKNAMLITMLLSPLSTLCGRGGGAAHSGSGHIGGGNVGHGGEFHGNRNIGPNRGYVSTGGVIYGAPVYDNSNYDDSDYDDTGYVSQPSYIGTAIGGGNYNRNRGNAPLRGGNRPSGSHGPVRK